MFNKKDKKLTLQEKIKKGAELLEELNHLKDFGKIYFDGEYQNAIHFQLARHYSENLPQYDRIDIPKRFNGRFLEALKKSIADIELEIDTLFTDSF